MDSVVLFSGFLLIFVNGITSGQLKEVWSLVSDPNQNVDTKVLHNHLIQIGGEFLLVGGLSFAAGRNKDADHVIGAFIFALWMLWFFMNVDTVNAFVKKVLPQQVATTQPPAQAQRPVNNNVGGTVKHV